MALAAMTRDVKSPLLRVAALLWRELGSGRERWRVSWLRRENIGGRGGPDGCYRIM